MLSLSTAALQQLGIGCSGPEENSEEKPEEPEVCLAMAQQTIDILAMLQEKTKGNLSEQESKLLGNILYDLRMRYVKASNP
ncbi:MAG: DUF1844 domain-containing protein [Deltaproteobacteria bacterium]|nr:DUF1844 domain-containing protein [Deltaproteobacteria bacterium]